MRRYNPLYEYVIKPEEYLNNIQQIIDNSFGSVFSKDNSLQKLCKQLTKLFRNNKIKFIPGNNQTGIEEYVFYGINEGASLPDEYGTIGIFCNPLLTHCIDNQGFFTQFKKWFLFICKHELVHRGQALQIKDAKLRSEVLQKDTNDIIIYLSDPQEVMARAWEIIELFRFNNYGDARILKTLQKKDIEKYQIKTLKVYHDYFEDTQTIKLLYKYMYQYIKG